MKSIKNFEGFSKIEKNNVFGGLVSNGEFIHTNFRFINDAVTDVFYDMDGSGTCNTDEERSSFSLTIAHPNP